MSLKIDIFNYIFGGVFNRMIEDNSVLFKIGDFSKLTEVSIRMLRYYDEQGIFKPFKIDEFTGYRFYCVEQIPIIQKIILLRDMNFSIKQIKKILESWENNFLIENLNKRKDIILNEINSLYNKINNINTAIEDIKKNNICINFNINFKSIPQYNIVSIRETISSYNDEKKLWEKLDFLLNKYNITLKKGIGNNLCIFHNDDFVKNSIDVEVGYIIEKKYIDFEKLIFRNTRKVNLMACMMVKGPYTNLEKAYKFLIYWLNSHNHYKICGKSRQICHVSNEEPFYNKNPENYLTEIQIPVLKI